jgi:hypothetical protein
MFCTVFGDLPALCDYLNEVSDVPTLSPVGAEPLKLVDWLWTGRKELVDNPWRSENGFRDDALRLQEPELASPQVSGFLGWN